jgi:hypothetical protein
MGKEKEKGMEETASMTTLARMARGKAVEMAGAGVVRTGSGRVLL